ncbi:MAG: hypothetical protein M2R45_02193 [Verrucomicrobia subdivision 3 bacterium]|nr:hypothetical protein [Limisphaerales bacterium]MCS1413769.1 hypothetical protein [Limisphaerales bacterium]
MQDIEVWFPLLDPHRNPWIYSLMLRRIIPLLIAIISLNFDAQAATYYHHTFERFN